MVQYLQVVMNLKILYKQPSIGSKKSGYLPFSDFGISNCYLKQLSLDRDANNITKKPHHHGGFEIHIIEEGYQIYESDKETFQLKSGDFLMIPPHVKHRSVEYAPHTSKFSLTFYKETETLPFFHLCNCIAAQTSNQTKDNFGFIVREWANQKSVSPILIGNRVFETIIALFRKAGLQEPNNEIKPDSEDPRLTLVKQYIKDNIELSLTVSDLAEYCYLSKKQITRLFLNQEGISPAKYIKKQRTRQIEKLLAENKMSLKTISEEMNFNNEYYFNTFFKKNSGMPPGAYQKMIK